MNSLLLESEAEWFIFDFTSPTSATLAVAAWIAIAFLTVFILMNFILKDEKRLKFLKISLISALVLAAAVIIVFVSLSFKEDGIIPILFWPLLILAVALIASAVIIIFKPSKMVYIICGSVCGAALAAALVCMGLHFASGDSIELNWIENPESVNQLWLYLFAVILTAVIVLLGFSLSRNIKSNMDTVSIAYAAVSIALSFALSYLKIVEMPQGGSITVASLLPLMLYSFMFGTRKGVFAGMIYGILQAVQDTYILHPAQFLLDYPIAFAAIGLAGAFANMKALEKYPQIQFALGAVIAGIGRFAVHFVSGIFAFSSFAGDQNVVLYSFLYQLAYVFPDILLVIVAGVLILSAKAFSSQVRKIQYSVQIPVKNTEAKA